MSSETWLPRWLRQAKGSLPEQESGLPPQVAEADENLRTMLSHGDALLVSPTFQFLMNAARAEARREGHYEAVTLYKEELAAVRRELDAARADLSEKAHALHVKDLVIQQRDMELQQTKGLHAILEAQLRGAIASANDQNKIALAVQSALVRTEEVRAQGAFKTALVAASVPVIGQLLKDSG